MYGLYSRAASNQERPMMARVRYIEFQEYNTRVTLEKMQSGKYFKTLASKKHYQIGF